MLAILFIRVFLVKLGMDSGCPIVKTKDSYVKILQYESECKLRVGDRLASK